MAFSIVATQVTGIRAFQLDEAQERLIANLWTEERCQPVCIVRISQNCPRDGDYYGGEAIPS